MFDLKTQQKEPAQLTISPKRFQQTKIDSPWKLSAAPNQKTIPFLNFSPPGTLKQLKCNPFEEIQKMSTQQEKPVIEQLDFSVIELKSPSYSEFFNSVGSQQKFFSKPKQPSNDHLRKQKLDWDEPYITFNNAAASSETKKNEGWIKNQQTSVKNQQNKGRVDSDTIPTFYIKMPRQIRKQQQTHRKQEQKYIEDQLQEIYNGKFKIGRNY